MTRASLIIVLVLAASALPLTAAHGICSASSVHGFGDGRGGVIEVAGKTLRLPEWPRSDGPNDYAHKAGAKAAEGGYSAQVADTNLVDCNQDGFPADYDGDFDVGVGGTAFGYGVWANDPLCGYDHHVWGPTFIVNDIVWGSNILLLAGEDDQSGPTYITDANGDVLACETDGVIDPTMDTDDCLGGPYVGIGWTCGSGGGDGLYWVFLPVGGVVLGSYELEGGTPPTAGTIEAF